jgi:hypothetical protein
MFDALRNDPRFQKLAASPTPRRACATLAGRGWRSYPLDARAKNEMIASSDYKRIEHVS